MLNQFVNSKEKIEIHASTKIDCSKQHLRSTPIYDITYACNLFSMQQKPYPDYWKLMYIKRIGFAETPPRANLGGEKE
jgi:hypothetical protein